MKRPFTAAVLILVTLMTTGVMWLLTTESGLHWAWDRAQAWTEITLSAESLEGTLAGPLQARELRVQVGGTTLDAEQITLDWQPTALLRGSLSFRQLTGNGVTLHRPPDEPQREEEQPFSGFSLPLTIELADGRLHDLKVLEGDDMLFLVNSAELSARFEEAGLEVAYLAVQGPWGRFRAEGRIGTLPATSIDLETDWRITIARLAQPIAGVGRITGTLAEPRFRQRITEPFRAEAEGGIDWQAEPLSWYARLETTGIRLDQLRNDWRPVNVSGTLVGSGQASAFTATGDLAIDDPELGHWRIDSRLQADERWRLERLDLKQDDGPARIRVRGSWLPAFETTNRVEDARVVIEWQNLSWPLQGPAPSTGSPEGRLTVSGNPSDYALDASLKLKPTPSEPPATVELSGSGSPDRLQADSLRVAWLDGEAVGSGQVGWDNGIGWRLDLSGSGVDPSALLPDWPGSIGFAIQGHGTLPPEGDLTADITLTSLTGTLRGEPLAGSAEARLTGTHLSLHQLRLEIGTASLNGSGAVGESWDMNWQLRAPQLSMLHPDLGGSIRAEGRLNGTRQSPRIRLNGSAERLELQAIRSKAVNLSADIDLAGKVPWDARLEIIELDTPQFPIERVTVTADGRAADHRIRIEAAGGETTFAQAAVGSYASQRWRGRLTDGALRGLPPGTWQQSAPASLSVDSRGVLLEKLCWASGSARACASAEGSAGQLRLSQFPLTALSPFIPYSGLSVDGLVNADLNADLASGYLDAEVAAVGAAIAYGEGEADLAFNIETARLVARSLQQGTSAELELFLMKGGSLEASLRSPRSFPFGSDAPVSGSVSLNTSRLGWVSLLVPDLADPGGQITGNFRIAGTAGNPDIEGSLLLEDGSAFIVPAGIRIRPIRVELRTEGGQLTLSGKAASGGGQIGLEGRLQRTDQGWRFSGTVSGEEFEASRLPYARVFLSPDLQLEVIPNLVTVKGRLHVPRAEIELRELPQGVERSPDVIVIREDEPVEIEPGWQTRTNVTVTFGDQVRLEGYGFSGRLTGRLAISEKAGQAATANGELRILEGRYEAYGQELTISEGRLLFAESPLTNPGINLRAIREVEEVTAGIEATGLLRDPEVRLFSEPPMEESDALAYLIVGRPLSQASRSEGSLLYNAALSLGLRGGNLLAQQIGSRFGIEEVEVERDPQSESAALVLGTHLSPRLYLQYVVAFAEAVNRVRIRYDLGTNWTLEAESGEQAGTDLFYTIER